MTSPGQLPPDLAALVPLIFSVAPVDDAAPFPPVPPVPPSTRRVAVTVSERRGGRPWRRLREELLAGNPVCAICWRRPATTLDHIVPLALVVLSTTSRTCARRAGGATTATARD